MRTLRLILTVFAGGLSGFALYCSLIALKEMRHLIWRGYFDWEGVAYQCLLPIGFPGLIFKRAWIGIPIWVNLETIFGAALVLLGATVAVRRHLRKPVPLPSGKGNEPQ